MPVDNSISLKVKKGETVAVVIRGVDTETVTRLDWTGWTGRISFRKNPTSPVILTMSTADTPPADGSQIYLGGPYIVWQMAAAKTNLFQPGTYLWDLHLTDPDGNVVISEDHTMKVLSPIS